MNPAGANREFKVPGNYFTRKRKWKRVKKILKNLREDCGISLAGLRRISDSIAAEITAGLSSNDTMIKIQPAYTRFDAPLGPAPVDFIGLHFDGRTTFTLESVKRQPSGYMFKGFIDSFTVLNYVPLQEKCHSMASRLNQFRSRVNFHSVTASERVGVTSEKVDTVAFKEALQRACDNRGLPLKIFTIEDMSLLGLCHQYARDRNTIAFVNDKSTANAAYVEKGNCILKHPELDLGQGEMVVLVDWKNFTSVDFPVSAYDADYSPIPNQIVFEKLTTVSYVAEVLRRVILHMSMELDKDFRSELLETPFSLPHRHVTRISHDRSPDFQKVSSLLADVFQITKVPSKFLRRVAEACEIVTTRSIILNAAAIAGILKKYGYDRAAGKTVGFCHTFGDQSYVYCVQNTVLDIVGNATNVRLKLAIPEVPLASAITISWHTPTVGAEQLVELE